MSEPEDGFVQKWLDSFTPIVENVMPAPLRVGVVWHVFCFRRKDGQEIESARVLWEGREDRRGNLTGGVYTLAIPRVTDQSNNPDYFKFRTNKRQAPCTLSGEALEWLDKSLNDLGFTRTD